ncbi:amidohydrolase [Roseococcus sp. SDR]|uniref:amidohydrolase n=1 Tax=Roseococcus sp. SDR TaxID=2835532 RepID=UPI001BCC8190|nr:amidohydrolase [Roseococcus sp. SDR]MBS7791794.1 amidohydrolase [Roseococcus sp. SDR]MBV1847108.1 amidohydrolase [Roseococcus sp. SDR]
MTRTRRSFTTGALAAPFLIQDAAAQAISLQDLVNRVAPQPEAVIYLAREVITMDPARPRAEAVAVVGGRIAAVGSLAELQALAGSQPFRLDRSFEGKVILPGFVEQHVHPVLSSLMVVAEVIAIEDWDTLAGFRTAVRDEAGYRRRFAEALAAHKARDPEAVFLTWGYHHYFHGAMSRDWLDQQAGTTPVIVWHRSQHEVYLNTALMRLYGVDDAFLASFTPSQRAQADVAKGHFFEQGALKVLEKTAPAMATPERLRQGLEFTVGYYHRNGITTAAEPGGFYSKPLQDAINAVYAADSVPFNHYFIPDGKSFAAMFPNDAAAQIAEAQKPLAWGSGRARWLPKQIKFLIDGAIYSQLMQMKDGYTDGHQGAWIMDPDVFSFAFQTFWDADYHIHIHNNGDGGMEVLLANLERAMRRRPRFDHRTTIVHFGFAAPEQVARAGRLGCIVSANPYYVTALAGRYAQIGIGPERARRMVPLKDAENAGMSISFHSDMPMAPAKPLQLIWAAVNRTTAEGPVMGEEQRVSLDLALRAMTIDAAHSIRLEGEVGSITPGKFANFTVLEQSPYAVPPAALKDIKVWGTVLEGRVQPAPPAPSGRAEAPRPTRLGGGAAPSGRFAATDGAALAEACQHPFCTHQGPDAALGCGCGGDVFAAVIAAQLKG